MPEVLAFTKNLFKSPSPDWLGATDALRAQKFMALLVLARPEESEKFYSHRNLNMSTEKAFWLAAITDLGSCWQMKMPVSASAVVGNPKGPRKVAFHHSPGTTI